MRKNLSKLLAVGTSMAMAIAIWIPGSAAADTAGSRNPDPVTVASGLNNPRQLTFDSRGNLYVAEAGSGQVNATDKGQCFSGNEGPACAGNTGSVTKVSNPDRNAAQSRIISGLLSIGAPDGSGAVGVDAVSVSGYSGEVYGIATFVPPANLPSSVVNQNGQLLKVNRKGKVTTLFDVASYSLAHPLPGHDPDSDPYGLVRVGGTSFVADAAANVVYSIDYCNRIKVVATFESRVASDPNSFDGVPTSIAYSNGRFYVGQLSSLIPGAGKITVFDVRWNKVATYTGLSSVTSVAVSRGGDIYATELFAGAPFNSPGAVIKIAKHQKDPLVISTQPTPAGVAVDSRNNLYVSINSIAAKVGDNPGGSVIRLAG
ncbi:MAG: ScyD/ScyE family protein [Nakamurella sp.]